MSGSLRAFLIWLVVSLSIPALLIWLSFSIVAVAMVFAFLIAPHLQYAYPFFFFIPPESVWTAVSLSVLQMTALAAVFAYFTRRQGAGSQWILAFLGFGAWWLICRLALGLADIAPAYVPRM